MRRISRGFTLLELILVIALMGMLSTIGVVMFSRMSDVWRGTTAQTDMNARADAIFEQMAMDFGALASGAVSGAVIESSSQTAQDSRFFKVPFDDDRITLPVELALTPEGRPQRAEVAYAIQRQNGEHVLVRTVEAAGGQGTSTLKVADGVLGMKIEFAAKTPGGAWQSPWTQTAYPGAVRVSILLMDPENPSEQLARKTVFPVRVD